MTERLHQNATGRAHNDAYYLGKNIIETWIFNHHHKNPHNNFTQTVKCAAKLCNKEGYRNWLGGSWVEQSSCNHCPVMILAIENARKGLIRRKTSTAILKNHKYIYKKIQT